MKKFSVLKTSSLILASYFILSFCSCSHERPKSDTKNGYYSEIDIQSLVLDKLYLKQYIANSNELKEVLSRFNTLYKELYIFNFPNTHQEYKIFSHVNNEFVNVGIISKTGTKIYIDFFFYDTYYLVHEKYYFKFDLSKKLEKMQKEVIYNDYESNYSYKVIEEEKTKAYSFCWTENNSVFEISLIINNGYKIKFSYDLLNNVEVEVSSEEYLYLFNSLHTNFKNNTLSLFIDDNFQILLNILKNGENETIYFEYKEIYKKLNSLTPKIRNRVK